MDHLTIAHYTADWWQHVCPVVRIVGPVQEAGWSLIKGNEWDFGNRTAPPVMKVFPERLDDADVVVIQRDFPVRLEDYRTVVDRAHSQGKPVIYELDDLLLELPSVHPDVDAYRKTRSAILAAVIEADAVLCSTPAIKRYLEAYNPNTWVAPNYLNDRLFKLRSPGGNNLPGMSVDSEALQTRPITIGYMGGHSHKPDLEMIDRVLDSLLEKYGEAIFLRQWGVPLSYSVMGRKNAEWLDIGLVDYAEFANYFMQQECDIFIAPLLDNTFNRCKSWLKFLEYSALGIPGVYSQLTPYETVVKHGENGFLARTPDDWKEALTRLIENPDLRRRMGLAAQETVRDDWLLSKNATRWANSFQQALAGIGKYLDKASFSQAARAFAAIDVENVDTLTDRISKLKVQADQAEVLRAENQEQQVHLATLDNLIDQARSENLTLKSQVELLPKKDQEIQRLYALYYEILNSTGWQMLQVVFRIRLKLIPRGTRRERWMRKGIELVKRARRRSPPGLPGRPDASPPEIIPGKVLSGTPCPDPAVSLVIFQDRTMAEAGDYIQDVLEWVKQQTLRSIEIVLWDTGGGSAITVANKPGLQGRAWQAEGAEALCNGLAGRYVCIASPELVNWHATFLEENLCALESEGLGFTINTIANPDWPVSRLAELRIPGSANQPLHRLVVNKRLVSADFSLDLASWLASQAGRPAVVGKIISHTASARESGAGIPLETYLGDVEVMRRDPYIIGRTRSTEPWGKVYQSYYDPCSVMPGQAAELPGSTNAHPTVLMAQTFLAVGGAERVALDMMRGLKDRLIFAVVTLEPLDPSLGTTTQAFRDITPYVYNAPDFLARPLNLPFHEYLIQKFKPRTYYIANGATWIYDDLPKIAQRHPKIRFANQVYDHQAGWINRYTPRLAALIDASIGVNNKICQAFIQRGAKPGQVYLIENGVDVDEFDPARYAPEDIAEIKARLNIPPDKRVVTYISRIHSQKRPMDFVELARRFSSDPSVVFLMVGDGELAQTVDALIAAIKLENIIRLPFYKPSRDIFAISDVKVLPSEYEGMPMVALEAQAMGKPIVVTDVGNLKEVLEATHGGELVNRIGDVGALRTALVTVLQTDYDPSGIRQVVAERFNLSAMYNNYLKALLSDSDA